jgi:hypothetical protein
MIYNRKNTIFYSYGIYEGDIKDGKPNGKGEMIYNGDEFGYGMGAIYEGDWINGEKHGKGKMIYGVTDDQPSPVSTVFSRHNDFYEGEWVRNKRHGQGKYIHSSNGIDGSEDYDGNWSKDKPSGSGRIGSGNSYWEGDVSAIFRDWEMDPCLCFPMGDGKMFSEGRLVFDGNCGDWGSEWDYGKGTWYFENGDVFEGDLRGGENCFCGPGKMIYANGEVYEGVWEEGNIKNQGGSPGKTRRKKRYLLLISLIIMAAASIFFFLNS